MKPVAVLSSAALLLQLSSAADCTGEAGWVMPEANYWQLGKDVCDHDDSRCPWQGECTWKQPVKTTAGKTVNLVFERKYINKAGKKGFGECWNALGNIVAQCARGQGRPAGSYTYDNQYYATYVERL